MADEEEPVPKGLPVLAEAEAPPYSGRPRPYYIHCQLQIEASIVGKSNYVSRFTQLFTIPRVRRATMASFVVMIAQQVSQPL